MLKSLVIIPTYKEKENIESIIKAVMSQSLLLDILIIDDNSPDGTANIVKSMMQDYDSRLHIMEREEKLGLGTAYIAGFKWALEREYELIFEMDADFSHNPNDLPKLYEACTTGKADVAVGSRYSTGVNVVNWPMGRVLMSYFASLYVRLVTGMPVKDTTAGFVCYRRKVLDTIDLNSIRSKGYSFQVEMKYTAYSLGFKVEEVSIIFINRVLGVSKMSSGIFTEGVIGVLALRLRKLLGGIKPKQ